MEERILSDICWHSKKTNSPSSTSTSPNDIQTCWHLQKTRCGQSDDQVLPILRDQAMTWNLLI